MALEMPDQSKRFFNGIVNRFSQAGRIPSAMGGTTLTRYRAEVVPKYWLLTRNHQSRIFQQISVPDILKKVLTGLPVNYQLQGNYLKRDFCVQYRESDFDFASRLMEEEGIFYFFKHSDGSHQMVVADTPQSFADIQEPQLPDLRDHGGGDPHRGPNPRLGEVAGDSLGQVPALGLLLRAAGQEPGSDQADPGHGPGRDGVAQTGHREQRHGDLRLPRRLCPAIRRRDPGRRRPVERHPEHLPGQPAAPSASGCSRRPSTRCGSMARAPAGR